jgi:regulator of protease activity HflC (stomatin/prohibitin superfamily)
VNIRDVSLPENMHRAIAKQAEAEREKRGRIIIADGELKAAEKMTQAANFYTKNIAALRLRELQTWTEIAREKNMIVVTGGETNDLGALLGIIKERTPGSRDLEEDIVKKIVKEEFVNLVQGEQSKRSSSS